MKEEITRTEGQGRSFEFWNEVVGIDLEVAYTQDESINFEQYYTIKQLEQLIYEKKIVIIKEKQVDCSYDINERYENHHIFETVNFNDFLKKENDFYYPTLKYLSRSIKRKKLGLKLRNYLLELEREINDILSNPLDDKVAPACEKVFRQKGYQMHLQKIMKS